jgi:hypothetical protein
MAQSMFDDKVVHISINTMLNANELTYHEEEKILVQYWIKLEATFGYTCNKFFKPAIKLREPEQEGQLIQIDNDLPHFKSIAISENGADKQLEMIFSYWTCREVYLDPSKTPQENQPQFDNTIREAAISIQPVVNNIKSCIGFEYDYPAKIVASPKNDSTILIHFALTFKKSMQMHFYEEQQRQGRTAY